MKRYNTLYYLLIVLLITGAFASIAQNSYGAIILGFVAFSFSILFLIQFIESFNRDEKVSVRINRLEFMGLALVSAVIGMRVFLWHFGFVEYVFVVGVAMVMIVYSLRLFRAWNSLRLKHSKLTLIVVMYYMSILLYLLSMVTVPFFPALAEPAGGIAFGLLIGFITLSVLFKSFIIEGEAVVPFRYALSSKDRSVLLLSLFLLFTMYLGFTRIGILPKMYSDAYPQQYFNLVNLAEQGQDERIDGKLKHERFKEAYDRFVERHGSNEK